MNLERGGWRSIGSAMCACAAWVVIGCQEPAGPEAGGPDDPAGALVATSPIIVRMTGPGEIGDGHPAGDSIWLQAFDLDAGTNLGTPYGSLDYIDYSVFKPDGKPAQLLVGPDDPDTRILGFTQISATCVEISGLGRVVNTGELVEFLVQACDNGTPGVGLDYFSMKIHERLVTHGSFYERGDMLYDGELTSSTAL